MKYGWFGNYEDWTEALADAKGYDDDEIFEKTKNSIQEVIKGNKKYERDTVLFARTEYEYHQASLAGLLKVALSLEKKTINVLDFGGSLGTLYFALKSFLAPIQLNWSIVEQEHYVQYGKENLNCINFYDNINDCMKEQDVDVVIFSSVLQYIEKPYETLDSILSQNIQYIILDRTAVLPDSDRLTIQKVPPSIYDSSYPAWFLNEHKIFALFESNGYCLLADFKKLWVPNIPASSYKGYIYMKEKVHK